MSVKDYRSQYAAQLDQARASVPGPVAAAAPAAEAAAADGIEALIQTLSDTGRPDQDRRAALRSLKAASFQPQTFEPHQARLRQVLRQIATEPQREAKRAESGQPDLRYEALQHLSREKDPFVQERLLEGLRNPPAALVSAAAALQMLAVDDHGRAIDAARQVLAEHSESAARQQALRVLAADPKSQDVVAGVLTDKAELSAVRQAGAVALRAINPTAFARIARTISADDGDYDEIREVARTGLQLGQGEHSR